MKKATVSVKINVADGFEIGDCAKCPIAIKEYKEYSYCNGINIFKCPLGYNSTICPMEIETANIKSEAVREFADKLKCLVNQKNYLLADIHNSKDFGMFSIGFEQAINEIVKEMTEGKNG